MDTKRNIQQVGSRFIVAVTKHKIRQRVTCATLEEALTVRANLELATATAKADQWTIGHAMKTVNEQVWSKGRNAAHSHRNAQYAVSFFGQDTLLDAISTARVDDYIAHLRAGRNSDSTINRKLAALSKLMSYARRRDKMRNAPHLERQKENAKTNGRMCFLTQTEEEQILTHLKRRGKDCHAEAVGVLIDTGLRPSELWNLTKRDVDLEQATLTIWKSKTDLPRVIPMTERVRRILSSRVEYAPSGPLFQSGGNHWFLHEWDKVRKDLGREEDGEFIPYALRHTFASRLVQRGAHIEQVQYLMGHSSLEMTKRYTRHDPSGVRGAIKLLER